MNSRLTNPLADYVRTPFCSFAGLGVGTASLAT